MRRKRNPLDRIVLKIPSCFTLTELSWYLQVDKITVKNWFGYYDEEKWTLKRFPKPERRDRWYTWSVKEIEDFLGIEIRKTESIEVRIIEPLLTIKDVAKLTDRAEITVRLWIREKRLKAVRVGQRNIRIERSELEHFVDSRYDYRVLDKCHYSSDKYMQND